MYQLESAKVKPVGRNGFWLDEDVSAKTISEMFIEYRKAYFILTNDALIGTLYLDMEAIKSLSFLNDTMTLAQWFVDIGNLALPTTNVSPDFSPQIVKYGDAWKANYTMTKVHPTLAIDVDAPESEKTDLLLHRSDIDHMAMGTKCLVSINGLLHKSEGSVHGLRVREGGRSSTLANRTQVGLLSFSQVGDFQIIPINRSMIAQPHPSIKLSDRVYLDTGIDLTNKSVLLSIGGYLHCPNYNRVSSGIYISNLGPFTGNRSTNSQIITNLNIPLNTPIAEGQEVIGTGLQPYSRVLSWTVLSGVINTITISVPALNSGTGPITLLGDPVIESDFDVVGKNTLRINWDKLPYAKRFFEQRKHMDLSSLGLSSSVNNPSQVSVEELFSDETIKRYLELSQSFLIVLDNPEFFCDYQLLESGELPGVYYSYTETKPTLPMQLGLGKLGNYWRQYDDGKWVMTVDDNYYSYYNFETTTFMEENSIDDTRRVEKPIEYSDAFIMTMGIP